MRHFVFLSTALSGCFLTAAEPPVLAGIAASPALVERAARRP